VDAAGHESATRNSDDVIVGAHKRITEIFFKELIKQKFPRWRRVVDLEGAYSVATWSPPTGEVLLEANNP